MDETVLKPLVFLFEKIEKPPFTQEAAKEAGYLCYRLQRGESLSMPHSRPMPSIGRRIHELRVRDRDHNWRIIYRADEAFVYIIIIFDKTTQQTPTHVIRSCQQRLLNLDSGES
jgi:phage-related protein